MESISAKQLAFLMNISQKDANKKICIAQYSDYAKAKIESELNDNCHIEIDLFEKKTGIPIRMAVEEVRIKGLQRKSYAKFLLRDFPEKELSVSKPPREVRLPEGLRTLLNPGTLVEIRKYWNDHYYGKKNGQMAQIS